eukprot:365425-Chlamydomonas_euryale.AAC.4
MSRASAAVHESSERGGVERVWWCGTRRHVCFSPSLPPAIAPSPHLARACTTCASACVPFAAVLHTSRSPTRVDVLSCCMARPAQLHPCTNRWACCHPSATRTNRLLPPLSHTNKSLVATPQPHAHIA